MMINQFGAFSMSLGALAAVYNVCTGTWRHSKYNVVKRTRDRCCNLCNPHFY